MQGGLRPHLLTYFSPGGFFELASRGLHVLDDEVVPLGHHVHRGDSRTDELQGLHDVAEALVS
jgi:hypothetical protein